MGYKLGTRSKVRLRNLHPKLRAVVERAIQISDVDFTVLETLRTVKTQRKYVASGASRTMKSFHLKQASGYSHAVDLGAWVDGKVNWSWPLYHKIAKAMKQAAKELDVPMTWGGDWTSFKDGPHYQVPRNLPV